MATRADKRVAGVVFFNMTPTSVEAHQVMLDPFVIRHGWLEILAEAAFGEHRLVVYAIMKATSYKALKYNRKLGFRTTGHIPDGAGVGVDYEVTSLRRRDCKYLKENSND